MNIKPQALLLALLLSGVIMSLYSGSMNSSFDWRPKVEVLRDSILLTWMVSLINIALGNGLSKVFGIRPRQLGGLVGVVFSPLFHRDVSHLVANTLPFAVLGWLILLQGEFGSEGDFMR